MIVRLSKRQREIRSQVQKIEETVDNTADGVATKNVSSLDSLRENVFGPFKTEVDSLWEKRDAVDALTGSKRFGPQSIEKIVELKHETDALSEYINTLYDSLKSAEQLREPISTVFLQASSSVSAPRNLLKEADEASACASR